MSHAEKFLAGLVAVAIFLLGTILFSTNEAHEKCLSRGWTHAHTMLNGTLRGRVFCSARINGSDVVVPIEKAFQR
jgi:hypothetical protein